MSTKISLEVEGSKIKNLDIKRKILITNFPQFKSKGETFDIKKIARNIKICGR